MIDFTPVTKIFPRCQKILPLVYDDSLSYYEVLCKLSQKTNVLIDDINAFLDWANQHESDYEALVNRVSSLEREMVQYKKDVNKMFADLKSDINKQFDAESKKIDAQLARFEKELDDSLKAIRREFADLERRNEKKMSEMRGEIHRALMDMNNLILANNQFVFDYVEDKLDYFIEHFPEIVDLPVYNPVKGETTGLQDAINDMYEFARFYGLTALQYDNMGYTASEYDAKELTALEYDQQSYILLEYPDTNWYMISPFTGQYTKVKEVVMNLASFHMDGLSATEYDALELTAEEYDAKNITAFDYDWFGEQILTA